MKKQIWKRLGFLLAILVILMGNLIGISALATEGRTQIKTTEHDDVPDGVLVGYMPGSEKIKTGEHFEYYGWIGAPFAILISDYSYVSCCKRTYRAMDGCKGLPVCANKA
jgi:hypothetical protein